MSDDEQIEAYPDHEKEEINEIPDSEGEPFILDDEASYPDE